MRLSVIVDHGFVRSLSILKEFAKLSFFSDMALIRPVLNLGTFRICLRKNSSSSCELNSRQL